MEYRCNQTLPLQHQRELWAVENKAAFCKALSQLHPLQHPGCKFRDTRYTRTKDCKCAHYRLTVMWWSATIKPLFERPEETQLNAGLRQLRSSSICDITLDSWLDCNWLSKFMVLLSFDELNLNRREKDTAQATFPAPRYNLDSFSILNESSWVASIPTWQKSAAKFCEGRSEKKMRCSVEIKRFYCRSPAPTTDRMKHASPKTGIDEPVSMNKNLTGCFVRWPAVNDSEVDLYPVHCKLPSRENICKTKLQSLRSKHATSCAFISVAWKWRIQESRKHALSFKLQVWSCAFFANRWA